MMRINPKLDAWGLADLLSDPGNWSLLGQVGAHPAAWPELRDWAAQAMADPENTPAPPEPAQPRRHRILRPIPLLEDDTKAGHMDAARPGPEPDDAVTEEILPETLQDGSARIRVPHALKLALAAILAVAMGAACLYAGYRFWSVQAWDKAMRECTTQAARVPEARREWRHAKSMAHDAAGIDAGRLKDPSLHKSIGKALGRMPEAGAAACPASSDRRGLKAAAERSRDAADAMDSAAKDIDGLRTSVTASRDAKTLSDAKSSLKAELGTARRLYDDSRGHITDEDSRRALEKAISTASGPYDGKPKAKDYEGRTAGLKAAERRVGDSMDAKARMDAESTQDREQAPPDSDPAERSAPVPTPQGQALHGGAEPPASPTPAPSAPAAPAPSTSPEPPTWSVPAPSSPDPGFPDRM